MPIEVQQLVIGLVTACAALWCSEHPIVQFREAPSFERYLTGYVALTACTESNWTDCGTMMGP